MASRRMISSDLYEDDFYMGLDLFGQNMWVGLIVRCADDQGRLQDNPILIKSQIYPAADFQIETVNNAINAFAQAGKVMRYEVGGKKMIQIINWWKHQTPSWAAASKYPAPHGWTDRVKVHGKGTQVTTLNWDNPGGFTLPNTLPNGIPNTLPNTLNEGDVKGEGNGNCDVNGESESVQQPAAEPDQFSVIQSALEKSGIIVNGPKDIKTITELVNIEAIDADIVTGVTWKKEQSGDTPVYLSSVIGPIKTAVSKRKQTALPKPIVIDPRHAALDRALERLNGKLS